MPLRKKLLPTFNAIAAGSKATCDLPLGLRYHTITLELSDNGVSSVSNNIDTILTALVTNIYVKINGKAQRTHSGKQLNQMNGSNGNRWLAQTSGTPGNANFRIYLTIFFAEPWRKDIREVQLSAWNMAGPNVESFQIEVELNAGLTTPNVTGFYEFEPATGPLGTITKVIQQSLAAVGTTQDFNTLDRRDFLQAIHLFPTSDAKYVNKVRLTANGVEVQDLLTNTENQVILNNREMQPDLSATPRFDLALDYDDPVGRALQLDGLSEFTLHVEYSASAAGTMPALIVRAGAPE